MAPLDKAEIKVPVPTLVLIAQIDADCCYFDERRNVESRCVDAAFGR